MAQSAEGFPPISRPDARLLILGSMPSRESLARQQYYAHPRNAFWPIVTTLLGIGSENYERRATELVARGVALWDVLRSCEREGSLDSAIVERSIVPNDFTAFFAAHPRIALICFNGAKAEAVYRKRVLPTLPEPAASIHTMRLPSTSPANAGMTREQKLEAWRVILDPVDDMGRES